MPTIYRHFSLASFVHSNAYSAWARYAKEFAGPLRNKIRDNAQLLAKAHGGVAIEHVNNSHLRKEDLVSKVLGQRGDHPGLVHILSAMDACSAYEPWHDKQTHKTYLRSTRANACIIISILWMPKWDSVTFVSKCVRRVPDGY